MNTPNRFSPSLPPIDPAAFAWRPPHQQLSVNRVEGYEHSAHAKAYLHRCAERAGLRIEHPERDEATQKAMEAAGYASWDKFTRHLAQWHDLARPMPRGYADGIGVGHAELLAVVEEDRQEHKRAVSAAPTLSHWTLRRMAGVYETRPFPARCQSESDCVAYVADIITRLGLRACIHVPGVKTLWLEPPDGQVHVTLYEPGVKFTRSQIIFADGGRDEATMRAL